MMGKPTTNWTRHKHAFLRRVAGGPCYASGVAEGTACTHLRALFWVRQVDSRIGIKVEITEEGRRALALWDAGERTPLDVRSYEQRIRDVVQDLMDKAVAAGVVAQLSMALAGQTLPRVEGLATSLRRRPVSAGALFHNGGVVGLRDGETPAILSRGVEFVSSDHPLVQRSGGGDGGRVIDVIVAPDWTALANNLAPSVGTICRRRSA